MPLITEVSLLRFTGVTVFHALLLARKPICVSITACVKKLFALLHILVEPPCFESAIFTAFAPFLYWKSTLIHPT